MMQLHTTQTRDPRPTSIRHCALALILALLATLVVCTAPSATKAYAADPIEISTPEELVAIKTGNLNVSYILTADIDLSGYTNWRPIGYPSDFKDGASKGFQGTLDGNGHAIRNLTITSFSTNNNILYAGLFGCTNGATIKNLTLDGVTIQGTYSPNGNTQQDLMVGSLVGLAVKTNISGCNVMNVSVVDKFDGERTDTKNYALGGLVGDYYTDAVEYNKTIENCSVTNAAIEARANFGDFKENRSDPIQSFTGGIAGRIRERTSLTASIVNCSFEGSVKGNGFVGPFAGGARSSRDEKDAASISLLAATRSIDSCYSGTFTGLNSTYNRGADVWDASWNYLKAASANNQSKALAILNGASDTSWRIAPLDNGSSALVIDHRSAMITSPTYVNGMATLTALVTGVYGSADMSQIVLEWLVDGQSAGSGTTLEIPITNAKQAVVLRLTDQGGKELSSASAEVAAAKVEFELNKTRNSDGDVDSLTINLKSASDGFTFDDFTYTWYGMKEGQADTPLAQDVTTLNQNSFGDFTLIKVIATSKVSSTVTSELTAHANSRVIYLSYSKGSDSNSGLTPDKPVYTVQEAYSKLKSKDDGGTVESNIIVVMDKYREYHKDYLIRPDVHDEYGYDNSTFNKPATITSYDEDNGVDYRKSDGAYFGLYNSAENGRSGNAGEKIKGKLLFADTRFKEVTLSAKDASGDKFKIGYIYCQGYSLTMDTGVTMDGYNTASQSSYGLLSGTSVADFNIVAGYPNWNGDPSSGYQPEKEDKGLCKIVLKSGSYARVVGGGRNFDGAGGALNKNSRNQFGSEEKPFSASITVDIADDQSLTKTTSFTADVAQLCGGQTDGTIYTNSILTLKNGKVTQIIGASIGYNRDVNKGSNTTYPNNDFVGTVQINMEGGSVCQLYGGCLGRFDASYGDKITVDSRFRSFAKVHEGNDIEINISGGSIGPITKINDGGINGVFAAGAGGITGEIDPETKQVKNEVNVAVNISQGTIDGKLYGGGYGQSSGVKIDKNNAPYACLEAGNLYGNSQVNITGGTIKADIYGGGAGTAAYLPENGSTNKLAQIVGDVSLSISNATIDGNVYGGSQGLVASGYDLTEMAKITGNVTLSVENSEISGSLYGGSALGTITGNVSTVLTGNSDISRIGESVYGGGQGAIVSHYSIDQQNLVGQVGGTATLSISGYQVGGTVFGGGKVGPVLGAAGVKTTIADSNITGSVYGGGEGSVAAGGNTEMQEILGQVVGSASLDITNTSIGANIYGGGAYGQVGGNVATMLTGTNNDKVVGGSIYGGGEGSYQAGNSVDQQTLIGKVGGAASLTIKNYQVDGSIYGGGKVGPVLGTRGATTNLENLTVGGSIYGGGEGITVEDNTNRELQTILGQVNGNATLTIANANVDGNVYGGGSKGAVFGSATTQVHSSRIGPEPQGEETPTSSLYAAGEGEYLGADNSDQTLQTLVGWVTGNASLTLDGDSVVTGNVFGGGNLGAVGDGILSSGSVPYEVRNASTVTVFVDKATIGGSIFGGGAGSALAGGQMPRLLGAVFGTSSVTVREANVAADVFGGGDQSYTYAPLDAAGHPQQATSVIVNGSDAIYVYEDDGRVAETAGNGVRLVDDAPGTATTQRTINLGGSVFGGGNIADAHTVAANNNTVYGNTEVFVKGQNVNFTNEQRGGVYGDGNLSRAYGTRNVTLIGLKTPAENNTFKAKSFFSIQRANRAIAHDCSIFLRGARDLVNESDTTVYSLNRVDNLKMYNGSTVQFETVVNGLGNLYSDVLPDRTFTSDWDNLAVGEFGDNLTAAELDSYRNFAEGKESSWTDAKGQKHGETNTIIVNNGKWLDVKESADTSNAAYGEVKGLFSLYSSTAADGGAFVFGRMEPQDSPGTFISLNRDMKAEGTPYLNLYTKQTHDASNAPCRIWFIRGDNYVFERDLKAYTTSGEVSIGFLLPVEQAVGTNSDIMLDGSIAIADTLKDMKRTTDGDGHYKVSMTMGAGATASAPLNFYEDAKQGDWSFDYGSYLPTTNDPGLVPVSININIADSADDEELETQSGTVEFTLTSADGKLYEFKINLIIERAYAIASKLVHHGRVYESIAVENTAPITPTSAYTMQFTTTYSPGAYRQEITTVLSATTTDEFHGESHQSSVDKFPVGTKITMVDITNPTNPVYYYHKVVPEGGEVDIPLTSFVKMADNQSTYKNPRGNTIIVEDLLFIIDYSEANGGAGRTGLDKQNQLTYISLNHVYIDGDNNKRDILCYNRENKETQETEKVYSNLWSEYEISGTTDSNYLNPQLQYPGGGPLSSRVKTGHTDNFMYDTYTTTLVLDPQTNVASTLFNEGELMMQLSLLGSDSYTGERFNNFAFPLGTKVIVKRMDGTIVGSRYYHEDSSNTYLTNKIGYINANLGNRLDRAYTIEIQVARYVTGGSLYSVFGWDQVGISSSSKFQLIVDLFVSPDGLYRPQGGPIKSVSTSFDAARLVNVAPPEYNFEKDEDGDPFMEADGGEVEGEFELEVKMDDPAYGEMKAANIRIFRKLLGSSDVPVDVTNSVEKKIKEKDGKCKIEFEIEETPPSGKYLYTIQIGNTVYYQEITVP